ncbi:coproporphyrinogen III oxidase-like protein [Cunninghamella echinulata]|nr:coproporphyrinogen III oxidase-like protein [Cunninghamella echinulata]
MVVKLDVYEQDNIIGQITKNAPMRLRMEAYVKSLQNRIVEGIEQVDGKKFERTEWSRPNHGGEGITCVLQDGNVIEKGGIAVSVVYSTLTKQAIHQMRHDRGKKLPEVEDEDDGLPFFVTGISQVIHAKNPNAPTVHLNYRYFEVFDPKSGNPLLWWFGGGADLTPNYLFEEDCIHFHQLYKEGCDLVNPLFYKKFKKNCDEYFYNTHRGETRGIGGIFFDDLDDASPDELFRLIQALGDRFLPSYLPILKKRCDMPFTLEMVEWQQIRRGRYVEFNLLWDRGTKFGLQTPCARVESILMTMPLTARWEYMYKVDPKSKEAELENVLKNPRDWIPLN